MTTTFPVLDERARIAKNVVQVCYGLHALGWLFTFGIATLISIIINYLKRPEAQGTFVFSHHTWLIRTFWWSVVWGTLGWILMATVIGIPLAMLLFAILFIWIVYRVVKGWLRLNENREIA